MNQQHIYILYSSSMKMNFIFVNISFFIINIEAEYVNIRDIDYMH